MLTLNFSRLLKAGLLYSSFIFLLIPPIYAQDCEIPNGDFETWSGDNPANWGTGMPDPMQGQWSAMLDGYDLQNVKRSTDSKSGDHSLHLKNISLLAYMQSRPDWAKFDQMPGIKAQIEADLKRNSFMASVYSCQGDCDALVSMGNPGIAGQMLKRIKFPVAKQPKSLCGFYKANLKGGDKLWINAALFSGEDIAGSFKPGERQSVISQSSTTWKSFKIPLYTLSEDLEVTAASLQISIVGAAFPDEPPYQVTGAALGLSIPGTDGSEVWIDDLCFCDQVQLDIWKPDLLGGQMVASGEKRVKGAQTFVNLDNDDDDEMWDYNPETDISDEAVQEDDELVKIRLRVPYTDEKEQVIQLEAQKGAENIRIWRVADKRTQFYFQREKLIIPDDFEKKEGYWEKELWLEGIKANTEQQGTVLRMYREEDPDVFDEAALTVIGIDSIKWVGIQNSYSMRDKLGGNPNHKVLTYGSDGSSQYSPLEGKSVSVFPGRRMVGNQLDPLPRAKVRAEVYLSAKPIEPLKLYFESYDVDDPMANGVGVPDENAVNDESWVDNEENEEDNFGTVEGYSAGSSLKSGRIIGENPQDGILEKEFVEQKETFEFRVSMQPGDNFRIVGSGDKKFIQQLHNNDLKLNEGTNKADKTNNKQRIVHGTILDNYPKEPKKAEVRLADQYCSPTLCVWRFFYAEVDHMDKIHNPLIQATVVNITHDSIRAGNTFTQRSKVDLDINIWKALDASQPEPFVKVENGTPQGIINHFKEGKFHMNKYGGPFEVMLNSAKTSGNDRVIILGHLPEDAIGKTCFLQDDDEEMGFKNGAELPRLGLKTKVINDRYERAYIIPDVKTLNSGLRNPEPIVPFKVNTISDNATDLIPNYRFDNKGLEADPHFWTVYLLGAYQGTTLEDGDANKEDKISGIADANLGAHIFMLGNVEFNGGRLLSSTGISSGQDDAVVHEIAHLFGAVHEDEGLMSETYTGGRHFSARSLNRIRSAKHP